MKYISKIKILLIGLAFFARITPAVAGIDTYNCYPPEYNNVPKAQKVGTDDPKTAALKQSYETLKKELTNICTTADNNHWEWGYTSQKNLEDDIKADGLWKSYQTKLEDLKNVIEKINILPAAANACGKDKPYGCDAGDKCWYLPYATGAQGVSVSGNSCKCSKEDPSGFGQLSGKEVSTCSEKMTNINAANTTTITNNADGTSSVETTNIIGQKSTTYYDENGNIIEKNADIFASRTNKEKCDIAALKRDYTSSCYSCVIVSSLIRIFVNSANKAYPVTREAGIKLLAIGMFLWMAFFVLQKISSFVSPEPMKILQDLFTFLFKCLFAYVLISSGLPVITALIVDPILEAGADYGIAMVQAAAPDILSTSAGETALDNPIFGKEVFDKIMRISRAADSAVSMNFVIGDAIICHAFNAGAWEFSKEIEDIVHTQLFFPDVWLWLCGVAIWFMAFMLVMGVNFYLLDLSFKIGFALLALPITIGLWPFNKFKGKAVDCIKIIANAAGTFMFLGITTGISIILINTAMGGTEELFNAINNDNKVYISNKFALTGSSFILILFAFLYSHKLVSETVSNMANKFFSSMTNSMNPMHTMTTQAVDFAKKQVVDRAVKPVAGAIGGAVTKRLKGGAKQAARKTIDAIRGV